MCNQCFSDGWCDDDRCMNHLSMIPKTDAGLINNEQNANLGRSTFKAIIDCLKDTTYKIHWNESKFEVFDAIDYIFDPSPSFPSFDDVKEVNEAPPPSEVQETPADVEEDIVLMKVSSKFMYT